MKVLHIGVVLVILAAAGACGPDSTGPDSPGVRVVSNVTRTDTIDAQPAAPLVLQLPGFRDGVAREVTISGVPAANPERSLGMIPVAADGTTGLITTTSTTGELSFNVRFGRKSGPAAIVITVQALQAVYSIWFEVRPGAPANLDLLPADTSIVLGDTYKQAARVVDRAGNDLNLGSQITTSTTHPNITLSPSNDVTGRGYARAAIRVQLGDLARTAFVSVVPMATFAGTSLRSMQITRSDGTEVRRLATTRSSYGTAWTPDGTKALYTDHADFWQGPAPHIFSVAAATGERVRIIPDTVTSLAGVSLSWPSVSRDGQWVFFVRGEPRVAIWRARADGTNAEEIVAPSSSFPLTERTSPSLSRDGSLLAYTSGADVVEIRDMSTGATRKIPGLTPLAVRWSPVDDRLAVRGLRGIYTMNADGTALRTLSVDNADLSDSSVDWSPDGKWLVVTTLRVGARTGTTIVDAVSGMMLPLAFSAGHGVSWAPN